MLNVRTISIGSGCWNSTVLILTAVRSRFNRGIYSGHRQYEVVFVSSCFDSLSRHAVGISSFCTGTAINWHWNGTLRARRKSPLHLFLQSFNSHQGYTQDSTLSGHTLFAPKTVPAGIKLPVLLWGEGGCSADSMESSPFLIQLASFGILVIASGTPKGSGSTTAAQMTAGTDWIKSKAGTGTYANVDASRIIAAGWSCGGVEAYANYWDSRVESVGIWSSGLLTNYTMAGLLKKPMFYFLGGSSDIAYANVFSSSLLFDGEH